MSSLQVIPAKRYVTYLRVSTTKQGDSGLGIEAQRSAVEQYVSRSGESPSILKEYLEIESGKRADRPQLHAAIKHAELSGARLVIARLDRLSRDVHFLSGLQIAGVDFVAADMPDANKLTVHMMAAVAQHERERISSNTKAALQAAKARGKKLGNPNGAKHLAGRGNAEAVTAIVVKADMKAERLRETIEGLAASGIVSARSVANALNSQGIRSSRGGTWSATTVQRLLARLKQPA